MKSMINSKFAEFAKYLMLLIAVTFFYGCGTYRVVEVTVDTDLQTKPEITTVPQLGLRMANYRNVVISYSKEYVPKIDNSNPNKASVLMRSDGVWITEIEREFVKKGFRVLSRQKYAELQREMKTSKKAASLLGADIIIQINSLEYSPKTSMNDRTEWTYKVFVSDSGGDKLARGRNSEENRAVKAKARYLACSDVDNFSSMALLDCKAIDAKTGELIMFYRNQIFRLRSERKPHLLLSYLFEQDDNNKWKLVKCTGIDPDQYANKIEEGINRSKKEQIRIEMIRSICSDFVNKVYEFRREGKNKSSF